MNMNIISVSNTTITVLLHVIQNAKDHGAQRWRHTGCFHCL